jgi:hypothetical protein
MLLSILEQSIMVVLNKERREIMAKIECRKCGATGNSKCPICRTVFMDDQLDAMLSHSLKRNLKPSEYSGHYNWLNIAWLSDKDDSMEVAMNKLREVLNRMADPDDAYPSFKQYACDHSWQFQKGHKSEVGCGCLGGRN